MSASRHASSRAGRRRARFLPALLGLTLLSGRARAHEGDPPAAPARAEERPTPPASFETTRPTAYEAHAVVTRQRAKPASSAHVHQADVASVPIRTAEDALRLVPGLVLVQHGSEGKGQQYFLRGFDAVHGADIELTVEDIPINEWSNIHAQGYLDVGFVIPELIQTLEVVKGPFSLEQGAFAMAGSARYWLGISPAERGARASYTVGTTGRQRVLLTYAPKDGDGSEFVAAEVVNDPSFGQNREARRANVMGRVNLMNSEKRGRLSLLLSGYAANFGLPGTLRIADVARGRMDFYDAYFLDGTGSSLRTLGALHYHREDARTRIKGVLYGGLRRLSLFDNFTGDLVDPVHGDYRDQRQRAQSFGTHLFVDHALGPELGLLAGAGLTGDRLDQKELRTDEEGELVALRRGLEGVQLLAFAQLGLRYQPTRLVTLEAGARGDLAHANVRDVLHTQRRQQGTEVAWSPRAMATVRAHPFVKLMASYGRGMRPPEARALTRFRPAMLGISEEDAGTARSRFTQSHTMELGARVRADARLSGSAAGFATLIERESLFDHVSGTNLELNGTRRVGAEALVTGQPWPFLTLSGDITGVDARFRASGNRVPFAPWLTGGLRAVLTHPSGTRAGLRFVAVAPRPLPHGARGEPLFLLDATAGYRFRWLDVCLALENLLFRQLREGEYHFASHWFRDEPRSAIPTTQVIAGPPFNARLTLSVFL